MLRLLLLLIFLVVSSAFLVELLKKVRIPSVVTLIIFGLIIGFPVVSGLLLTGHGVVIDHLGEIGLVSLMFIAGMESDWKLLLEEKKDAFVIAILALLAPLVMGAAVIALWGFSIRTAVVVAVCLSVSAEATRCRVLMELKKLRTRMGAALVGAGIVDDVMGLALFIVIAIIFHTGFSTENLLIMGSLAAFFVGVGVQKRIGRDSRPVKWTENTIRYLIIPFFFISIGLGFDINSVMVNPFLMGAVLVAAFTGKFIGAFMTRPFLDLSWKQLYLVGWGMNSRGALGLAIALVAFRNELVNVDLYSALVITSLLTTISFPFILYHMVDRDPSVME